MQGQEARILLNFMAPAIENESQTTRKVIAAIPEAQREYRPNPKARTAMELAWHIAGSEAWFLDGITKGEFGSEQPMPAEIKTPADVADWYGKTVPGLIQKLKGLSDEQLARPLPFFGLFNHAAVVYLSFLLTHSVHHRGYLAAYLRGMGAKVPSIYGGSADEPFQMSAEQ